MLPEAKLAFVIIWRIWRNLPLAARLIMGAALPIFSPTLFHSVYKKSSPFYPKNKPGSAARFPDTIVTGLPHLIFNNILSVSQKHIRIKHAAK